MSEISIFGAFRNAQTEALKIDEQVKMYTSQNSNPDLVAEYWSFEEVDYSEKEVASIVDALPKLKGKELQEAVDNLRKFKRRLKVVSIENREQADQETGEIKTLSTAIFQDVATGRLVHMAQARIVGQLLDLNKMAQSKMGDNAQFFLTGMVIDVSYRGKKKNKNNAFKSDVFSIQLVNHE